MTAPALFPAKLTRLDGTTVEPVKVATTDRDGQVRVTVWAHEPPAGIVEVASFDPDQVASLGGRRYEAEGATIEPGRGCGCGHPLKRFRPPGVAVSAR